MMDAQESEWLTTPQAAALAGCTPRYLTAALKRGRLKGMKRGRDWLVQKSEVLAYVAKMERLGSAKHNWRAKVQSEDENNRAE